MKTESRSLVPAFLKAIALLVWAHSVLPSVSGEDPGFESLFNGRDLSGWTVKCQPQDQSKVFWKVEEGAIVCDSMGRGNHNYVWLLSEKEYGDFELRLKFQVFRNSPGNSGVQFRSRYDTTIEGGWLHGPQMDIHPPVDMNWRTGLIYDETKGEQRWVFPSLKDWNMDPKYKPAQFVLKYAEEGDVWNDLIIRCDGLKVQTTLNGIVRTDWDGTGVLDDEPHKRYRVGRAGHFALQLHSGDQLKIRFRDLRIRKITSANGT